MNTYKTNGSNRLMIAMAICTAALFPGGAAAAGSDVFKAKCAGCHGAEGGGNTALGTKLKLRDLRSAGVQKQSDSELQSVIEKGKPPMPAFGKTIQPAGVLELVAYMRSIAAK